MRTILIACLLCAPVIAEEKINSAGVRLVKIEPGSFQMGTTETRQDLEDKGFVVFSDVSAEHPRHLVTITKPFWISECEITIEQFKRFVVDTEFRTDCEKSGAGGTGVTAGSPNLDRKPVFNWRNTGFPQDENYPVVNLTWNDCKAYCRWLSSRDHLTYRLPTEAEWEYCCRAGTITRFSTGDERETLKGFANCADITSFKVFRPNATNSQIVRFDDKFPFASPVRKFKPNKFGLYDMHGNAWEWCEDWYETSYYARSPINDPKGPEQGSVKVFRGGSWFWGAHSLGRSSMRYSGPPDFCSADIGFRVVCENL